MSTINGNLYVAGILQPAQLAAPPNSIGDSSVITPAAGVAGIQTSKTNHRQHVRYSQAEGAAVVTESRIVWITHGTAGTVISLNGALKVACIGAATITVDLKKNGTSVLASVLTFNSSAPIMAAENTSIATGPTAAGDVFEIVVTATVSSGTLGQGLYAEAIIDENPS
jgi:hypothetical protein